MKKVFVVLGLLLLAVTSTYAQRPEGMDSLRVPIHVKLGKVFYHGDSVPHLVLKPIYKFPPLTFKDNNDRIRYSRLVANIKRTLPLAKLVKETVIETYEYLQTLPNEKARKAHIKLAEQGIRKQYTPMVKKLTFTQGKILVKLIDRECNQSSFSMVEAFLGPVRANFYQVLAWTFGNSLKKKYDPKGADREMERIVLQIESGQL